MCFQYLHDPYGSFDVSRIEEAFNKLCAENYISFVTLVDHTLKEVERFTVLACFARPVEKFHHMCLFEVIRLQIGWSCLNRDLDLWWVPRVVAIMEVSISATDMEVLMRMRSGFELGAIGEAVMQEISGIYSH